MGSKGSTFLLNEIKTTIHVYVFMQIQKYKKKEINTKKRKIQTNMVLSKEEKIFKIFYEIFTK